MKKESFIGSILCLACIFLDASLGDIGSKVQSQFEQAKESITESVKQQVKKYLDAQLKDIAAKKPEPKKDKVCSINPKPLTQEQKKKWGENCSNILSPPKGTPPIEPVKGVTELRDCFKENTAAMVASLQDLVDAFNLYTKNLQIQLNKANISSNTLSTQITQANEAVQQSFKSTISKITDIYCEILSKLEDRVTLANRLTANQTQEKLVLFIQTNPIVSDAIKSIIVAEQTVKQAISNQEASLKRNAAVAQISQKALEQAQKDQAERQKIITQLQQEAQEKKEYTQRVQNLLSDLSTIIPTLTKEQKDINSVVVEVLQNKPFNQEQIKKIESNLKNAIAQFVTAYKKNNFPITFSDASNFAVTALRTLIDFYMNITTIRLQQVNDLVTKPDKSGKGFEYAAQVAQAFLGTENNTGFNKTIESIVQANFKDESKKIIGFYSAKRKKILFHSLSNILQGMVINSQDLTEKEVGYAQNIYGGVIMNIPQDNRSTSKDFIDATNNIATIYATHGNRDLKNMAPGTDNSSLRSSAEDNFKKAAQYFSSAGNTKFARQYTQIAQNLNEGQDALQSGISAFEGGNISQAIDLFKQAQKYFKTGADAVDVEESTIWLNYAQGKDSIAKAQTIFTNFMSENNSMLINYLTTISPIQTGLKPEQFAALYLNEPKKDLALLNDFLTALEAAVKEAYSLYGKAQGHFQIVNEASFTISNIKNVPQTVIQLSEVETVLQNLDQALNLMLQGNDQAADATLASLTPAQKNFDQALLLMTNIDGKFAKILDSAELIPIYPQALVAVNKNLQKLVIPGQTWSFEKMVVRHRAFLYTLIANAIPKESLFVAIQYYQDAEQGKVTTVKDKNNNDQKVLVTLLTPALFNYINQILIDMRRKTDDLKVLFENAQAAEKTAQALPESAWKVPEGKTPLATVAWSQWLNVLHSYHTGYHLGYPPQTQEQYIQAIRNAIAAVTLNKKAWEEYYPELFITLLYYRLYLVAENSNMLDMLQYVLTGDDPKIIKNVNTFFQKGTDLLQTAQNEGQVTQFVSNQKRILDWLNYFDYALQQQKELLDTFEPQFNAQFTPLFAKNILKNGDIECVFLPTNKKITIPSPQLALANAYQSEAKYYFDQEEYAKAYKNYENAINRFTALGLQTNASALKPNYRLSLTRSMIQEFNTLINKPRKTNTQFNIPDVTVAGVSVPQRYELYAYEQEYPEDLPTPANLSELVGKKLENVKEAVKQDLIGMATYLFLDNKLKDLGLDFSEVYNENMGIQSSLPSQIDAKTATEFKNEAELFNKNLSSRIESKQSSLYLTTKNKKLYLGEVYKPILGVAAPPDPGVPVKTSPYNGFPIALMYFSGAYNLAQSGDEDVQIGGVSYVPGNQPSVANEMVQKMAEAYLSDSQSYNKVISYITTGKPELTELPFLKISQLLSSARTQFQQVQNLKNPTDFALKISDYMDAYSALKNYLLNVLFAEYSYVADYYKLINSPEQQSIQKFNAEFLEKNVDTLKKFLIGDPSADQFYTISQDIARVSKMALGLYGEDLQKELTIYSNLATIMKNIGDSLFNAKKYFAAISWYSIANAVLGQIQKPNQDTSTLLKNVRVSKLRTMYTGSTDNMAFYQQSRFQPVKVGNQTVNFKDLLAKYQQWGAQGGANKEMINMYLKIKAAILDALIYYAGVGSEAAIIENNMNQGTKAAADETPALTLVDPKTKKPVDPIGSAVNKEIDTYLNNNGIQFDTLANIILFLKRKDLREIILNGFEQFAKKITGSTDKKTIQTGYRGISEWANKLYLAFSKIYMSDYLGGEPSNQQWLDFSQALKTEEQNIIAPASSYFGSS